MGPLRDVQLGGLMKMKNRKMIYVLRFEKAITSK
jgi:hypothetical protein